MRRKDKEITDINEIEAIIKRATHCHIGLTDDDEPYVVPVNFGYERNALYFHGALEGRKVELIQKNNKVCFEMDTDVELVKSESGCDWGMKYRSVIGMGRAHILENDEEKLHSLRLIQRHYAEGDTSIPKSKLDSVMVVKIEITSITGKKSKY